MLLFTRRSLIVCSNFLQHFFFPIGLPSWPFCDFKVPVFCFADTKLFKNLVAYCGIIIVVRNLLLEALLLWTTQ